MVKLTVEKDEAVADLVERVLENEEDEITLVVPKKSHLLDSKSNFKLLAREAKVLGKKINIESVDQEALDYAKAAGLQVNHPLFDDNRSLEETLSAPKRGGKNKAVKLKVEHEDADELEEDPETEANRHGEAIKNGDDREEDDEERYDTLTQYGSGSRFALLATIGGIALLLIIGLFLLNTVFAKADITVNFKKYPWTFNDNVGALTSVRDIDPVKNTIPGQLFQEEKSLTQAFAATGETSGTAKAHGIITVVNNFGKDPQQLVATTRFETPDGKIFRLDTSIVVPGATVVNGKITPASIKAAVTADQGGATYNVGKIDKLTIPGFKTNAAKYAGFYGILENGASGGGSGARKVATDSDVANAKDKLEEMMQATFQTTFLSSIPSDMKVLDKASGVSVGKVLPQKSADQNGNFSVTLTGSFRAFGFKEEDLVTLLNARANQDNSGKKLEGLAINYSKATPDFDKKQLSFSVDAKADLVPDFHPEELSQKLAGLNKDEAKNIIAGLPDLDNAKVTIWPSWLSHIPKNQAKIHIVVE